MPKKQVIKIKPADLDRAAIRGLSRSAWETKKSRGIKEQVHVSRKQKEPKHKKRFANLEEEF